MTTREALKWCKDNRAIVEWMESWLVEICHPSTAKYFQASTFTKAVAKAAKKLKQKRTTK